MQIIHTRLTSIITHKKTRASSIILTDPFLCAYQCHQTGKQLVPGAGHHWRRLAQLSSCLPVGLQGGRIWHILAERNHMLHWFLFAVWVGLRSEECFAADDFAACSANRRWYVSGLDARCEGQKKAEWRETRKCWRMCWIRRWSQSYAVGLEW